MFGKMHAGLQVVEKLRNLVIGFGFVSFATLEAANVAIDTMNGAELRTKRLFVDLAKRKDELKPSDREHDDHQK